ncbi:hypothetical protein C5E10_17975, partial [Pseudoclavibacter sp. RFBG4]
MIEGELLDGDRIEGEVTAPPRGGVPESTVREWDAETLAAAKLYALEQVAELVVYALESRDLATEGDRVIAERLDELGITDVDELTEALDQLATGLAGKSPLGHTHDAATLVGLSAALVGLANVDNTRDMAKPVSTLQAAAIALRAPLVHQHAIGDVDGLGSALAGKAGTVDVQTYLPTGAAGSSTTYTWTKPAGAKMVHFYAYGPGGGGGSGAVQALTSLAGGGGGGGAGSYLDQSFPAALVPNALTIRVGKGGAGAAPQTSPSSNGNTGGTGGVSQISAGAGLMLAVNPGFGGGGGTNAAGGISGRGEWGWSNSVGVFGGGVGGAGGAAPATPQASNWWGGSAVGGGGGGGLAANSTTPFAGAAGGVNNNIGVNPSAAAGAAGGGNGADAIPTIGPGVGGGGGGSSTTSNGGTGGTGSKYG